MSEGINKRLGAALCLVAALMTTSLGCRPAGSSSAPSSPNKAPEQKPNPDNKDRPSKRPNSDVG